jgi:KDO2-lipid IV(A) lauroyltransferase
VAGSIIRAALTVLGQLPLPLLHAIGWLLGNLAWLIPNGYRKMTVRQLELCLPELKAAERQRIARASLIESLKAICEIPAIWYGPKWRVRRWIRDPVTLEVFRKLLAGNRGAIWLTPHQGAWEIAGFFCAQAGPITLLYKPQDSAADEVILRGRSRLPRVSLVSTDGAGVKSLLAALRRHEMVGILPDHDPPEGSGKFAPLFGMPAHTMDLVPKLAARSGAPVWFIVAERLSWGRGFRFHALKAPDGVADPAQGAARVNAGLETCIRRWPEQYWWSYKRFRRRPPGTPDPYRNL